MEFCNNHSKLLKTSSSDGDKNVSNIFVNKFLKDSSTVETNDNLKDQSFKISIDKNNNKHVLSPLGNSQGPRGIKVSRLSLQCSESSIRHSLIQQFGIQNKTNQNRSYNIKSIVLESAAGPSPTRWAIVTFVTAYDAEKALQMASKSQSVELHPGYDLFDFDELNITTNCSQGLDEFHPKASRTLQISNLPPHLNNFKTLYEYFSKLGKVLDIEIKPKLVLHASALIQFSDISKVVKILVSPRTVLKCLVGSSITSSTSFQFGPSFPTNCIWLGQISNSISENQITEYFSRFGHVLEVVQDVKQQKALVYLDNAFAAQQSIIHLKRKNSFLGTCRVQVDYASLECQATISYWLSNNFLTLPVPPDVPPLKQPQSENNSFNSSTVFNRSISRINSNQEKLVLNINKSITIEQNSQLHSNSTPKQSDLQTTLNLLSNLEPVNYTQPTISIKNYQNSLGNSGLNISDMVITERIPTDNATRVQPICNKRSSSNIRVTNPYDSNCDTSSNNRFSQNYEPSINSTSFINQTTTDFPNPTLTAIKKDRFSSESSSNNNNEGKSVNNIRLSCSPVTWSANANTSQASDVNKSDMYNRQFSPWTAPVRTRVVARVDPFSHTSSNTHSSSQVNSNILSKTIPSSPFINRLPTTMTSHNISRNIQKTMNAFPEKEFNATVKQESIMTLNKNVLHSNERDFGSLKRRTNYNQPLTYRVAKNPDSVPKSFNTRTPVFSGVHKLKSKNLNYKGNELSEDLNKQITAAEVFGEDFSDLSDSDSASSYVSNSRKRKQKLSKCKSPSVDSSSTISVLSSEKQNRFIRIPKVHYHTNQKNIHMKSTNRSKSRLTIKSNKFSSGNASSDEPLSEFHSSSIKRHKMKMSLKENTESMSSSMKPLTVNVSLSNFEDNPMESDSSSPETDDSSVEIPKKCLNSSKKAAKLTNKKRKISVDKSSVYQSDNLNASSSSDNDQKGFQMKYKSNSSRKSKSFANEHDDRKRTNSYIIDRRYTENKFMAKVSESRIHKMKLENDHHSKSKMNYSSTHNYIAGNCFNEKDSEKISYMNRGRQISDSPPIKRKKSRHEEMSKGNIYRSSDKKMSDSTFNLDLHSSFKRHEYQQGSQEISSDAVFQKEFDEFKRDQASDQSSVHRKGNSSKVSSASSLGMKTFSSYDKYKSQKSTKPSKLNSVYTTSDCKNIFQIDMNNINMYESMYDKVKRRAQKQAETKVNRNSPEINEPRNKRKSKVSEHKHKSSKDSKMFYKRHKKSRDIVASPTSTAYSDDDSALIDDSQSNYSSTMYVASEKDSIHRIKNVNNKKAYKSAKNSTVSSFESPNSFSTTNWKRSRSKGEILRIIKYSNKVSDMKYCGSKRNENEDDNENEEHENISEFSFKTNTSNINFSNKPIKEYFKGELEEVANISDATVSTEPMEYAEVDLESLKMSDDDWKSGLSSQSSSESGNNTGKIEIHQVETLGENPLQSIIENENLGEKENVPSFTAEESSKTMAIVKRDDESVLDNTTESLATSLSIIETEIKTKDNKESCILIEVENQECVKEEQDIAIASIMLKEENDSKSPLDWKSNLPHESDETSNSINPIFEESCNSESLNANYDEIVLISASENTTETKNEFQETNITPDSTITSCENVAPIMENTTSVPIQEDVLVVEKQIVTSPSIEMVSSSNNVDNSSTVVHSDTTCATSNKVATESKMVIDQPSNSISESVSIENSSPVVSVSSSRYNTKASSISKNSNTNEKIDLTSYVKGVIEQVKREQSAENQNKLKTEKSTHKRIKKFGNPTNLLSKNNHSSTTLNNSSLPVSLLTLQKSPTISLQSSIIENSDLISPVTTNCQSTTPNIPGVNVCSPVTSVHMSLSKPNSDSPISSLPEIPVPKILTTRSNIISIINISSGPSLKTEHASNSLPELKINTELNVIPTSSDLNSSVSDPMSTQLSSANLKSPLSEDHTKQRICTRLRRADPSKSDSNYKIVTTTCVTKSDVVTNNNCNQSKSNITDSGNQILSNKSVLKQTENISVSDTTLFSTEKISDPYEPNFDESPLEFSRYRSKAKNTFFPSDSKTLKMGNAIDDVRCNTPVSLSSTVNNLSAGSLANSGIDSVSQIIEDVVHGNFNYSEYLTSFKSGKLSSFQISPSTTPLTFVSNDSRDCSSVSADNLSGSNFESVSTSFRKQNSSKSVNPVPINVDDKKTDLFSTASNPCQNTKPTVALLSSLSTGDLGVNGNAIPSTNKISCLKKDINLNSISKSNTQNISLSPVFNSSNASQINTDILALINFCKSKDSTTILPHEPLQQSQLSSPSIHSYNRDVSSIIPNTCVTPFDKSTNNTSKLALNVDQKLSQAISNTNLLNITVNSSQLQQNINPLLSSVVHHTDENNPFKQFCFNILQRSHLPGLNVDSSALTKLQTVITESSLKNISSSTEANSFRNIPNINHIDSLAISSTETNQESVNSLNSSQNISSKIIAELIIPRTYPLVWEGKLSLKNEEAKVALHFVHGNTELLNACMHLLMFSGSLQWNNTGSLKIVQRMRLDLSQLEGVQRRMQNSNEFCIGLALPGGDDGHQWMKQSQILKEGFIKYMREKGAAGIINVCHPENNQQGLYVVHIFPPCDFSANQLHSAAPDLQKVIEVNNFPSLLVVITTV